MSHQPYSHPKLFSQFKKLLKTIKSWCFTLGWDGEQWPVMTQLLKIFISSRNLTRYTGLRRKHKKLSHSVVMNPSFEYLGDV